MLLAENPGLVVLRVTGYGQTGPYSDRAGFGTMAEGMSTLAHTTGQPDGPPTLPPIALADEVTGLRGAFAVLAALRHRDLTGRGQVIDISLLESLVDMVGPGPAIYHRTGQSDGRIGSRLCFSAPRNIYRCKDGYIVLSGSANQVALRVFDAIGRSDLRKDPRFTTGRARIEHVEQLDAIITEWTVRHTVAEAIETIAAAGAAVGPVYDAEALVSDRHVQERGCFVEVESPAGNEPILQLDVHRGCRCTPGSIRHAGLEPRRQHRRGAGRARLRPRDDCAAAPRRCDRRGPSVGGDRQLACRRSDRSATIRSCQATPTDLNTVIPEFAFSGGLGLTTDSCRSAAIWSGPNAPSAIGICRSPAFSSSTASRSSNIERRG